MSHSYLLAMAGLAGCGRFAGYPTADLADPQVVSHLEAQMRPERLHNWLIPFPPDDHCAAMLTTTGDRTVADGSCEVDYSDDGAWDEIWDGHAERRIDGEETRISYDHLVVTYAIECAGENDVFDLALLDGTATEGPDGRFVVDLGGAVLLRCDDPIDEDLSVESMDYTFDVSYEGEVSDTEAGREWHGNGRYADSVAGYVESETRDYQSPEFIEGCGSEPELGRTTLSTQDHAANLEFDGATACDGLVSWTLDGTGQPDLESYSGCSTGPTNNTNLSSVGFLGVLVGALAFRTRARWHSPAGRSRQGGR